MLKELLNDLLNLFKGQNLIPLEQEHIKQEGNFLVFVALKAHKEYFSVDYKIFVARHSLALGVETALSALDSMLLEISSNKANALDTPCIMEATNVALGGINNGLFVYEITLNLKIRRK